jgi:hypothetical protein
MGGKRAFGAFVGVVLLLLGTTADAQLAKRGTYTSTVGWPQCGGHGKGPKA